LFSCIATSVSLETGQV